MTNRSALLACLVVLAICVVGAGSAAGRTDPPAPDYVGELRGTDGRVEFRINRDHGRPSSVRFAALKVRLACEDGSTELRDYNTRNAPFLNNRVFDAFFGREGRFYGIHGELRPSGRAVGFIVSYDDVFDPPEDAPESECSTDGGKQRWIAHEVAR
jgi:hypothetical protein